MKLDLSEIASHLGKRISYEIDEPTIGEIDENIKGAAPVKGEVTFSNTGRHIVARGHAKTAVDLDCSRCLGRFRIDLELPIEEELRIAGHLPDMAEQEEEEELPEEEKEPLFVDNVFDLGELIRQSILMALPIKPLCSEECKGLCPRCGHNLNEEQCKCPKDEENPAFAELGTLLAEKDKPES